jgi:hypothetical protein
MKQFEIRCYKENFLYKRFENEERKFLKQINKQKIKSYIYHEKNIIGIMQLKYLLLIFAFTFTSTCVVSAGNKQFLKKFFLLL